MPVTPDIPEELPLAEVAAVLAEPTASAPAYETVETVSAPETTRENELMIDVHMPHTTHTWKDFWIHLGTITVGLLIALGLERGAETLHHLEQGRQLAEDLQQEATVNRARIVYDETVLDKEMVWLLRLRRDVSALREGSAREGFVYPEQLEIYPTNPNRSQARLPAVTVWATAKESNLIQLLRPERARNYNEVYREADLATSVLTGLSDKWLDLDKFELRFEGGAVPAKPDVRKMTAAELDEYVGVLGNVYLECKMAKRRMKVYAAWNESILAPGDKPFETSDDYLRQHADPPIDLSK
jgi:hypothetical protein